MLKAFISDQNTDTLLRVYDRNLFFGLEPKCLRFRFDPVVPKSLPEIKLKQKYGEIHRIIENSYILLGLILKVSLFQNVFLIFLNFPKNQ